MNIFQFLKTYYETRNIQYNWYNDIYKVILSCSTYKKLNDFNIQLEKISTRFIKNNMPELPIYNDTVLKTFIKFYPPEWLEDGITKETMDKFTELNESVRPVMSGSGPTVFAIVTDEEEADLLSDFLKKTNSETYLTGLV